MGANMDFGDKSGTCLLGEHFAPDKLSIPKFMLLTVCN